MMEQTAFTIPDSPNVAVYHTDTADYPHVPPFHPSQRFPEYRFATVGSELNAVYDAVRSCFKIARLDIEHYGTPQWNPLRHLLRPGETVVIKPNLIKERHPRDPVGWRYVLTHGSVIRAVADYIWLALEGEGRVVIADAPQTDSSFHEIAHTLRLNDICEFYAQQGLDCALRDLRQQEWVSRDGVIVERRDLAGDPLGYLAFDLAERSEFQHHDGAGRYYGADYDSDEVNRHHSGGRHEYLIAATAIDCDVLFNLPKLKTHKKTGVTIALKNLVGINGDKNWLPHHTEGNPAAGGDEYPTPTAAHLLERFGVAAVRQLSRRPTRLGSMLHRLARRLGTVAFKSTETVIRSGNWWGNDTTWRMCLDLNKILLYGKTDGTLPSGSGAHRKRHYTLVDGIIAGQGRGPMNPDPVRAGLIAFGVTPACVDAACTSIMGFDPKKIPVVRQAFLCDRLPLTDNQLCDVNLVSNRPDWNGKLDDISPDSTLRFEPHFGWKGRIERP